MYFCLRLLNTWNINRKLNSISHISEAVQSKYFSKDRLHYPLSAFSLPSISKRMWQPYQVDLQDPSLATPSLLLWPLGSHTGTASHKGLNPPSCIETQLTHVWTSSAQLHSQHTHIQTKIKLKYWKVLHKEYPVLGQFCSGVPTCHFRGSLEVTFTRIFCVH